MSEHDFNVYLEIRKDIRGLQQILHTQMGTIGLQLGAWLVVGNGAGIFFMANAAAQRDIAMDPLFSHTYALFLIGAAIAFLAICWSYLVSIPMGSMLATISQDTLQMAHREQLTATLEADKVDPPESFATLDEAANQRLQKFSRQAHGMRSAFGVALGLYFLSGICLLTALATPLVAGISTVSG